MSRIYVSVIAMMTIIQTVFAQDAKEIAGTYFLKDVQGVASGFNLKPNYTFTFFYTKDNLTRTGSGRWDIEKNTISFNGRPRPARDFKLVSARKVNDNFVTVQFSDENDGTYIKDIQCTLYTARGRQKIFTNKDGIVQFTRQEIDSLQILSPLFPDHPFTYIPLNKIQNSFEFSFEKWVAEVFFEDFTLQLSNNVLSGKHPLLKGNTFLYIKDN
ncbi:MAG: hypothetical protein QM802_18790 [Agriterribacter sp.]